MVALMHRDMATRTARTGFFCKSGDDTNMTQPDFPQWRSAMQIRPIVMAMMICCFAAMSIESVSAEDSSAESGGIPGVPTTPVDPVDLELLMNQSKSRAAAAEPSTQVPLGMEYDEATMNSMLELPAPAGSTAVPAFETSPAPLSSNLLSAPQTLGTNFQGINYTGWFPADPILAVGTQRILQAVNSQLTITTLTGSGASTTTLKALLGNPVGGNGSLYDPWVQYDHFANRFVLMCLVNNATSTKGWYVFAVSKNATPTISPASWYIYYLPDNGSTNFWGDYDKVAFDATNFYITSNQFNSANQFQYAKITAYPKSNFYSGRTVSGLLWNDVRDSSNNRVFSIQPAVTFGYPGKEYLVSCASGTGNTINVFSISGSPLVLNRSKVTVQSWSPPNGARQKGSTRTIHSGDARLLGAVYRNNRLYTCHTIRTSSFPCAAHYVGINTTNMTRALDTVIGHASYDYYYPAVTVTSSGNLGTVVNFSSPGASGIAARYAGIAFTKIGYNGAISGPLSVLKEGQNTYYRVDSSSRNRWGDYNGMCLDPSNNNKIWFNSMFATSSANVWGTWVGSSGLSASPSNPEVQASFDPVSNTLTIAGDDAANEIRVHRHGRRVTVAGQQTTKVNERHSDTFVVPAGISLAMNMGGGDDHVTLLGMRLHDAAVSLGDGNDHMSVLLSTIDDLNVDGGDGLDSLVTTSSEIGSVQKVSIP